MTQTLKVDLGERSYPIHIGRGLLAQPDLLKPHIAGSRVMVVTNETVDNILSRTRLNGVFATAPQREQALQLGEETTA